MKFLFHSSVKQSLWWQAASLLLQGWIHRPETCLVLWLFGKKIKQNQPTKPKTKHQKTLYGGRKLLWCFQFCFILFRISFSLQSSYLFMNYVLSNMMMSHTRRQGKEFSIERHVNVMLLISPQTWVYSLHFRCVQHKCVFKQTDLRWKNYREARVDIT